MGKCGVFFLDFVTQYFVDIFSESPKSFFSQINSGIAQFSTKRHKNDKPIVSKDYWYQRTTQWVKFNGFGEFIRIL